jgi:hypothetical protein
MLDQAPSYRESAPGNVGRAREALAFQAAFSGRTTSISRDNPLQSSFRKSCGPEQARAADALPAHDVGVLAATTAFRRDGHRRMDDCPPRGQHAGAGAPPSAAGPVDRATSHVPRPVRTSISVESAAARAARPGACAPEAAPPCYDRPSLAPVALGREATVVSEPTITRISVQLPGREGRGGRSSCRRRYPLCDRIRSGRSSGDHDEDSRSSASELPMRSP